MTQQLQEAMYIQDLIFQRNEIKAALSEENKDILWTKSALELPNHLHSDIDPNYLELLAGLDSFDCHENPPTEAIDTLRDYINKQIDENLKNIEGFLKMRVATVKENIKHQKARFKKHWGISYKEALEKQDESEKKSMHIDDILDKINEKGIDSLNSEEKDFLKKNSKNQKGGKKQ